jgi:hypothetical protein
MASSTIDHLVSVIVFIAALVIFLGLFSQTNQTALTYERHRALSTKTSDLLDTIVLNPGLPNDWATSNNTPTGFGVQDPEFTQYQLSSFSLMRLSPSSGATVEFDKTLQDTLFNEISLGEGASLLTSRAQALNYSAVSKLLGINGAYGFQLSLTPTVTVSIVENQAASPLSLSITTYGTGFPLVNSVVNYCLILVNTNPNPDQCPSYSIQNGAVSTGPDGATAPITFPIVTDANQAYAFIAYAHLDGVVGVGYHTRSLTNDQTVIPIVESTATQKVALAHSYDLNNSGPPNSILNYNSTFLISREDYTLRELSIGSANSSGMLTSGIGYSYPSLTLPSSTTGILIVTYQNSAGQGGVKMMPWGVSSLAFPVTFGGTIGGQEWVATDIRQVLIGGVAYQAKLALWSLGYQVNN